MSILVRPGRLVCETIEQRSVVGRLQAYGHRLDRERLMSQKITPSLWFKGNLEEALEYYKGIFPEFEMGETTRYGEGMPFPAGTLLTADFTLNGQAFNGINAGPEFTFTEAISFIIECQTQEEVDYYWNKLTADGGEESVCGWLKDRFGLSWQVVPRILIDLMNDDDSAKANRVMQAMFQMRKIDIPTLQKAAAGE
jgi:predicted 3-demethylubiquinone-9 3-methyltransferase (glyoxalase superfamily)